jgi:DNA polymerase I
MYPSIIKVRNISYETVRCSHPECGTNMVPETMHWTCVKHRGIISEVIGLYRDLRVYFYKPLMQSTTDPQDKHFIYTVSQALKVILNSAYGVLGFENFQYYYLPAAEAVAAWGRQNISIARAAALRLNMTPVIIDTDSLYLTDVDDERERRLLAECEAETGFEMDSGSRLKYVVASGLKKNYFGVTEEGRVIIRGLTGKKRHTPPFIRRVFNDVLTNILAPVSTKEELAKAKDAVAQRLKNAIIELYSHKIPLKELEFQIKLSRPLDEYKGFKENKSIPQHVKVAKILRERGESVEEGAVIRYVKTHDGAKPTKFATSADISAPKYVEFLQSIFSQVLEPLGMELRVDANTREMKVDNMNHKRLSDFI